MDKSVLEAIGQRLNEAENIVIATHVRPDGDAIGSLLGLGLAMAEKGKNVQMVLDDPLPISFRHLEGSASIRREVSGDDGLMISVDCSDVARLGSIGQTGREWDINIDHHITNEQFAKMNLIDVNAVATAEIIATYLPEWGFHINKAAAEALLTGILTDTIGFRTSNMKPSVLRLAARLMELGADLPKLYAKGVYMRSFEAMKFWGCGLTKLERKGGLVWTVLTMMERKESGYSGKDDADLINLLTSIPDAKISVVFVEQPNGNIKVSWRAVPEYDVSTVATEFGGGGHAAASGAEVCGTIDEVREKVLERTSILLNHADHTLRLS